MPRGFASTVVNWITMSLDPQHEMGLLQQQSRAGGASRKLRKKSFLFSFGFFYHFYYLLFEVIHQQAATQLCYEVVVVGKDGKQRGFNLSYRHFIYFQSSFNTIHLKEKKKNIKVLCYRY